MYLLILNMAVNCNITAALSIWYCYKEKQNKVFPLKSCCCNRHAQGCFMFLQFPPILNFFFSSKLSELPFHWNTFISFFSSESLVILLWLFPERVLVFSVSLCHLPCWCLPTCALPPEITLFKKLVFKGTIDALGFASVWADSGTPLMWGWGGTALPRTSSYLKLSYI